MIANITDIDDKILAKSAAEGVPWFAHAYRYERELHAAYAALGCAPPTYEPRATGHVPEMLELIEVLMERGHAYAAADGSGDVYFDVRSWPAYGSLSNQKIDDMEPAGDADPRGKRDPRDFALWKGHKPEEPYSASWPTPWGRGRPGWHLECSAMAGKYLGDEFDIHGGGLDLRFPHHENELAQSTAAGQRFARFWMHNALLTAAGEKMSKSLGNGALVSEVTKRFPARAVRLYLTQPHYRSTVEYSDDAIAESAAALARIDNFVERATELVGTAGGRGTGGLRHRDGRRPGDTGGGGRAARGGPGRELRARTRWTGLGSATGWPRSPGCWTCSGSTPTARTGRPPVLTGGSAPWSTGWSPHCWPSARRPAPAGTSPPPTPSATRWPTSASRSPTPPAGPRWSLSGAGA